MFDGDKRMKGSSDPHAAVAVHPEETLVCVRGGTWRGSDAYQPQKKAVYSNNPPSEKGW